jgi:hypothetical protein
MAFKIIAPNGQKYTIDGNRLAMNRAVDYNLFEKGNYGPYQLDAEDWGILSGAFSKCISQEEFGNIDSTNWHDHPATSRQREYLAILQVRIPDGYPLTKGAASTIIGSVKSGNGVGSFGLTFTDGSN